MLLCDKKKKKKKKKKQQHTHKNFLAKPNYKLCFMNKSNNVMKDKFFGTLRAAADADCLIVATTLKLAKQTATALVG